MRCQTHCLFVECFARLMNNITVNRTVVGVQTARNRRNNRRTGDSCTALRCRFRNGCQCLRRQENEKSLLQPSRGGGVSLQRVHSNSTVSPRIGYKWSCLGGEEESFSRPAAVGSLTRRKRNQKTVNLKVRVSSRY